MIKLKINPSVLAAIQAAFPKPSRSAQKALDSYTTLLETVLTEAISYKRSSSSIKKNIFVISADRLSQEGPRLRRGKTCVRLHKWLSDNNLALVQCKERGNNITHQKSVFSLTNLAQPIDVFAIQETEHAFRLVETPDVTDEHKTQILVRSLYHDFDLQQWNNGDATQRALYDVVPINTDSLARYLQWLLNKTYKISPSRRRTYARQAQFILLIAKHYDGYWPQRRINSSFGRTYYAGTSIQNINKLLRQAVLAPATEYDLNTSVCAWKLSLFANHRNATQLFPCLYDYVTNKREFIASVRTATFPASSKSDRAEQTGLIKQAITALSFGATLTKRGWKNKSGLRRYSAICDIFHHYPNAADLFIRSPLIAGFAKDNAEIDDLIYDETLKDLTQDQIPSCVKRKSNAVSKSKLIAYLYQHAETQTMNALRAYVETQFNQSAIAVIHDAVFFRNKLSGDKKSELTDHLQTTLDNPFLTLKRETLTPFTNALPTDA